jgi:hypothetical protein
MVNMIFPQAGRPRHRNAAAPGANGYPTLSLKVRAPAKAAYAMTGIFLLFELEMDEKSG